MATVVRGTRIERRAAPAAAWPAPGWLALSLPIAALAIAGSIVPFFADSIYSRETADWAAQATGQDIANLVIFPAMLVAAALAWRGSTRAYLVWLGLLGYSVYAYTIYSFALHWSRLFLVDVAVFGMSAYALAGGLSRLDPARVARAFRSRAPVRSTSAALIVLPAVFGALWLAIELPAAISGTPPSELHDVGLVTNPVHVLDLGIFLPAVALTGVLLRRRHPLGLCAAPAILAMLAAITTGILSLMAVYAHRGLDASAPGAIVNALLLVVELGLLVRLLRAIEPDPPLGDVVRPAGED